MAIISEEIIINLPVSDVFEFVAETPKLVEVWPSLTAIRDWKRDENGLSEFTFEYQIIGFKYSGRNKDIEYIPNKKIVTESQSGMEALLTWEFEVHPSGTLVRFTGDYNVEIPLIGKVVSDRVAALNGLEVGALLKNMKMKLERENLRANRRIIT
jgi:ribosome-associated toxin RatA of RatAB toxin-antitoxin module